MEYRKQGLKKNNHSSENCCIYLFIFAKTNVLYWDVLVSSRIRSILISAIGLTKDEIYE